MNKKIALLLILCMAETAVWSNSVTTSDRLVFFTWEIVCDIRNSTDAMDNFKGLKYYLSAPFSVEIEHDTASRRVEIITDEKREGMIIRGQLIPDQRMQFIKNEKGALRTIESDFESFVIVFKDTSNETPNGIPLRFRKNAQGLFDLVSVEIDSKEYNLSPRSEGKRLPQLCVIQRVKVLPPINIETRVVPDSTQDCDTRQAASSDTGGQAHQTANRPRIIGTYEANSAKTYKIQVGVYSSEANVLTAMTDLQRQNLNPVREYNVQYTRVLLRKIPASQVATTLTAIKRAGFNEVMIQQDE